MVEPSRELAPLRALAAGNLARAIHTAVITSGNTPDLLALAQAAIDSMAAYFVACTEHDDASRHHPIGL